MKKRHSNLGRGIELLEGRIPPGYALAGAFGAALTWAWSPAVGEGTGGPVLDVPAAPPAPLSIPEATLAPPPAPAPAPPADPGPSPMVLAMADPAPALAAAAVAAPLAVASPVASAPDGAAVPVSALGAAVGQPSAADGSDPPVPPAATTSGGPVDPGGGGSVSTPNGPTPAAAVAMAAAPASSGDSINFLASDGYLPGMTPPDDGASSSALGGAISAKAAVSKDAAAATSSGLTSTGTRTSFAAAPDPGTPGPDAISTLDYEYGYSAITLPDLVPTTTHTPAPVELDGEVTFPTDLSGGPHPLIMIMHGRHSTAYNPVTDQAFLQWPPAAGNLSIPSFQGYEFVADTLASQGFIVVSIGANGINAVDNNTPDDGMKARAELIEAQLNLWNGFDTTGGAPFADPSMFVGKVDMQDIGLMGHSRGGEGVVEAYDYNLSVGDPYGIKAVFALAPVDFQRLTDNNVPFAVMLPYADGDVSDLQGMHYFDDEQYNTPGDQSPKYEFLVMGADHDLFNTVWTAGLFPAGAADDWAGGSATRAADPYAGTVAGNQRLTPAQQQGVETAYMSAFFNVYLAGQDQYLPILKGDAPTPASALGGVVYATYQAPDNPATRLDVNRTASLDNLTTNTLGGAVTESGLSTYTMAGGASPEASTVLPGEATAKQPDTVPSSLAPGTPGKSQLVLAWDDPTAWYQNDIPASYGDVSGYSDLQFRAGVNFDDIRNSYATQDFSVVLTDASGHSASTPVSEWTNWLFFPPGKVSPLPKLILQGIRIPLTAFAGVDLTNIRSVRFDFDQRAQGALVLSDLQFSN